MSTKFLPKSQHPVYEIELPSNGQKLKIRPFLVSEEKIFYLCNNDDATDEEKEKATEQVINNCVLNQDFDINTLTTYDTEYLFLQLRIISVGESLTLRFEKIENSPCSKCCKTRNYSLDLTKVKVEKDDNHDPKIQLNDNLGVIMKAPSFQFLRDLEVVRKNPEFTAILKVISKCISSVYDEKEIYDSKDFTVEEFISFLESLTTKEFQKIDDFFTTLPKLKHVINLDCPECGLHQEYHMEGLSDFLE